MTTVYNRLSDTLSDHSSTPARPSSRISVNGQLISRQEIARETQHHPAPTAAEAWEAAARALVVRALLLQEAHRHGLQPLPALDDEGRRETDDEALIRQLIELAVPFTSGDVDEGACRRLYASLPDLCRAPDLFGVRHILLAAAPGDAPARQAARAEAQSMIAALTTAPERFADLAAARSACPSGRTGGLLGQISRGQTVPEFEAALPAAPIGVIAPEPVETRYGFHVIIVDQYLPGPPLPFEAVRPRLEARLVEERYRAALHAYLSRLAHQATIRGFTLSAQSPNLQQQDEHSCSLAL